MKLPTKSHCCPHCYVKVEEIGIMHVTEFTPVDPDTIVYMTLCLGCGSLSLLDEDMELRPPTMAEYKAGMKIPEVKAILRALREKYQNN